MFHRLSIVVLLGLLVTGSASALAQTPIRSIQTPLLGVNAQESAQGLVVRSVIPNGPAAGQLNPGDVLRYLTSDGHPVYSVQSFIHMKKAKTAIGMDVPAYLEVLRGDQRHFFSVVFQSSGTVLVKDMIGAIENPAVAVFDGNIGRRIIPPAPAHDPFDSKSQAAWTPRSIPQLQFDRLVIAKIVNGDNGSEQVAVLKPRWLQEQVPYTFTVTVSRPETRTRTVNDPKTSEPQEESYTVMVPSTEERQGVRTVLIPSEGEDRVELALDAVTAWSIGGEQLSVSDLKSALKQPKRVFVLPPGPIPYQYDPYFASAIDKNVIVMAISDGLGALPAITASQATEAARPPQSNAAPPMSLENPSSSSVAPKDTAGTPAGDAVEKDTAESTKLRDLQEEADRFNADVVRTRRPLSPDDIAIVRWKQDAKMVVGVEIGQIELMSYETLKRDGIKLSGDQFVSSFPDETRLISRDNFLKHGAHLEITPGRVSLMKQKAIVSPDGYIDHSPTSELVRSADFPELTEEWIKQLAVKDTLERSLLEKLRAFVCSEGEFAGQ